MIGAQRVLEPGVGRAGIDEKGMAELPNITQALHRRRVDDREGLGVEADVVPERVANDLELGRWDQARGPASRTAEGTRSANCSKFLRNSAARSVAFSSLLDAPLPVRRRSSI